MTTFSIGERVIVNNKYPVAGRKWFGGEYTYPLVGAMGYVTGFDINGWVLVDIDKNAAPRPEGWAIEPHCLDLYTEAQENALAALRAERDALAAEVERLRAALQRVDGEITSIQVDVEDMAIKTADKDCILIQLSEALTIIREALETK